MSAAAPPSACAVVELRRYRLRPGRRDDLVALFERELVETQEAVGMRVIGQFGDLDEPDQFVWLRGFADLAARDRGLRAFYGGPVWGEHREAANATMIDSDDVLLLRPAWPGSAFATVGTDRPPLGGRPDGGALLATTCLLRGAAGPELLAAVSREIEPAIVAAGGEPLAVLATEPGPNGFAALPVREGEHAVVWIAGFASPEALDRGQASLRVTPGWSDGVPPALAAALREPVHHARLAPTPRSLIRGGAPA
ncbi:MAG: hypothetical protein QOH43_3056 [Solirubrobacteraceae bacterium]|nr:hypothetical protein [Solirubrobacteraceae bacterium]